MSIRFGLVTLGFVALSANVQASAVAGHDYVALSVPQPQETKGKIEVIEFFSWVLGHTEWETLARAYYALQSDG